MSREALKTAAGLLVRRLGGVEAAASATRVGAPPLSEYQAHHRLDRHMPVDVVWDLEAALGEPVVTAALARALGYRLVRIGQSPTGDVVTPVQRVSRDAGELAALLMDALADHAISASESDALMAVGQHMRAALDDFMAALAAGRHE